MSPRGLEEVAYILSQENVLVQDNLPRRDPQLASLSAQDVFPATNIEVLVNLASVAVHNEVGVDPNLVLRVPYLDLNVGD